MSISHNVDAGKSDMEGLLVRSVTHGRIYWFRVEFPPLFFRAPGLLLASTGVLAPSGLLKGDKPGFLGVWRFLRPRIPTVQGAASLIHRFEFSHVDSL